MKAICRYIGKSESTVLKYIRDEGLPAGKIGGEWISDEGRIDDWRLRRVK
jgi:predicted DNA-binding transcriptional regulator AlpA